MLIQRDGFKAYGLFKDNLMEEKLDMETFLQRKNEDENKVAATPKIRCKSANMKMLKSQSSKTSHNFSRRPMLDQLMKTLAANNGEQSEAFHKIKFKYRDLGVNAEANNYAFANDCYSQCNVTPMSRMRNQV